MRRSPHVDPHRCRWFAAATALLTLTVGGRAQAAEDAPTASRLEFTWEAEGACPSRSDVYARIRRRLGDLSSRPKSLRAEGTVRGGPGAYALRLRLRDEGEESWTERHMDGGDCAALADAAALIIAIAFDPTAATKPAPLPVPKPTPKTPPAAPVPPPAVAPEPRPPVRLPPPPYVGPPNRRLAKPFSDLHISLRADATLDLGTLPAPAGGVGGMIGVHYGALRGWLHANFFWDRDATLPNRPSAGGTFQLWTLGARGCGVVVGLGRAGGTRRFDLGLCGSFELGQIAGEGFGVTRPSSGTATWFALAGGADAGLGLAGPLRLRASAFLGLAPFTQPFSLEGLGDVHRPSFLVGRLSIGPELMF